MKEKLLTIVVLPLTKAHILKMRLEAKAIKCILEDVHLIDGSTTSTVRVKILEDDIQEAMKILDNFLGFSAGSEKDKAEEKKKVLLPIDFSRVSEKAALQAFNIAHYLKAQLVIMHSYISPVHFVIPYGDIYPFDTTLMLETKEAEEDAHESFKKFVSNLAESVGTQKWEALNPEYIVKPGYANEDILAYAREHLPRLIVIGRGGDKSWPGTVGSVTSDIMYNAPVPVLVVPEEMENKTVADFSEILYATNFDAKDFSSLDNLIDILRPFDIKLTCAHVGQAGDYGWDLARLEGMKDVLDKKFKGKQFECKLLMGRDVLKTLESYLETENVDALALTTHKRNMISRLFNPSLARQMVFHTNTPLLIFHA